MRSKKSLMLFTAILAATSLTGCEQGDKDKAADIIDNVGNVIKDAVDNAPTGQEIVNGLDKFGNAVSA